uniref:Uncharacterized protein n=2 Tax=Cacopsylla melanoneura TaxID=428564 RepID=A0A8D8SUB3_9HEMI
MPQSGPVYQPTTVSYEQQSEWSSQPRSYLAQTVNRVNNPRCVQWSLLALGLVSIAIGCILFIEGTVYTDSNKSAISIDTPPDASTSSIALAVIGIILVIIGVLLVIVYIRLVQRRKGWPCFNNKSQRLTRDLDNQTNNGQILTLNHPSTDLLVTSSQYNTVNEVPPTLSEEEETRKLMGNDNKDSYPLSIRSKVMSQHQPSSLSPRHLYEARHSPRSSNLHGPLPREPVNNHALPREPIPSDANTMLPCQPVNNTDASPWKPNASDTRSSGPSATSRLLKALRAPLASVEDMTSSLESSSWSVTSRRDSVARVQLLANESGVARSQVLEPSGASTSGGGRSQQEHESVLGMTASRFSV